MSEFLKQTAYLKAIEIIVAGLQNGVIKLAGVQNGSTESNEEHIAYDVAYINGLINGIAKNLTKSTE